MAKLPKNAHGEFHNDVLEEAEKNEAIRQYLAPQLQAYKEAVEAETAADFVDVEPPLTEELAQMVDVRDKVQTGFKAGARAMMEMDDESNGGSTGGGVIYPGEPGEDTDL